MSQSGNRLFIGIGGHVVALDRTTGSELWRRPLGKVKLDVTLFVDEHAVYAGYNGELFCFDPATGEPRWHNPLRGLGRGLIVFGPADVPVAAAAQRAAREDFPGTSSATLTTFE